MNPKPKAEQRAALLQYLDRFGDDGARYFADGLTYAEALEMHILVLEEKVQAAKADAAQQRLDSMALPPEERFEKSNAIEPKGWDSLFRERQITDT